MASGSGRFCRVIASSQCVCRPLISAWQLKVSPVRVRLRELLSILLAAEIAMQDGITSSSSRPSGGLAGTPVEDDAFQTAHLPVASGVFGRADKGLAVEI